MDGSVVNFDPSDPETRRHIDEFKAMRLADPYRRYAYDRCVESPGTAYRFWIEQIADAELYEQAYREGTA